MTKTGASQAPTCPTQNLSIVPAALRVLQKLVPEALDSCFSQYFSNANVQCRSQVQGIGGDLSKSSIFVEFVCVDEFLLSKPLQNALIKCIEALNPTQTHHSINQLGSPKRAVSTATVQIDSTHPGLDGGAVAGIVIGALVIVALIVGSVAFFFLKEEDDEPKFQAY